MSLYGEEQLLPAVRLPNVATTAVPEHDAVAASEPRPHFSVLVGVRAPPLSISENTPRYTQCAPIDLVAVLDVSSSMKGKKIDLVKQAVGFIVDNLGPSDRLSVVTFDKVSRIIFPLIRMTDKGRADAKRAVDSILANRHTNILEGLKIGAQVLQERSFRNPVASIMLLSDGKDTCRNNLISRKASDYLPPTITSGQQTINVHTFGFGPTHNELVMHDISDASGGTFSFIKSYEAVQTAFARCIGGLLSVVTRDLRLTLKSASHGVEINSIPSGKHSSVISDKGSCGLIIVGDLYADEKKEFLIDVSVPVYRNNCVKDEGNEKSTSVLDITCSYKDVLSNETVLIEFVEIRRPGIPLPSDVKVKLEVDRQKNRLDAAEGFVKAERAAEAGDLERARDILSKKRSTLLASKCGKAGDVFVVKVEKEMKETEDRMKSMQLYEKGGRAYALSNISAHSNQRATSTSSDSASIRSDLYVTPNMANMVIKSSTI